MAGHERTESTENGRIKMGKKKAQRTRGVKRCEHNPYNTPRIFKTTAIFAGAERGTKGKRRSATISHCQIIPKIHEGR